MSNYPVYASGPSWWGRFSADPRMHGTLRASDADRDVAVGVLQDAFAEGRLTEAEQTQRIGQALAARSLGELVPLLGDLPDSVSPGHRTPAVAPARRPSLLDDRAVRGWLGLAIIFNLVWLLASFGDHGFALDYYWPIWPMLGTAIPVLMSWITGGSRARDQRRLDRDQERLDRRRERLGDGRDDPQLPGAGPRELR